MRATAILLFTFFAVALHGAAVAHAQMGPVIVVPGRPGVPVMIDGVDATGAIVYGDWGLARPGHGRIIIEGPVYVPGPWHVGGYYPSAGHAPRYGRLEIEPRPRPRAPTDYHRSWSTQSDMSRPATTYPPFNPPEVIVAPRERN